jgi:hypothetical protein
MNGSVLAGLILDGFDTGPGLTGPILTGLGIGRFELPAILTGAKLIERCAERI